MATHSIGSAGRDFPNPQAWADSLLVALSADEIGECYNDSEFVSATTFFNIVGHTGAFWIRLRCATGQSFQDNAGVRTNPLKYDSTKGVAFRSSVSYNELFQNDQPRSEIRGFQIKGLQNCILINGATNGNAQPSLYKDLILEGSRAGQPQLKIYGSTAVVANANLFVFSNTGNGFKLSNGAKAIGCAVIRTTDQPSAGIGFDNEYSNNIMQSCSVFGFSTVAANGGTTGWDVTNSKFNATDSVSGLPGTNNQYSVTFNQFTPFTNNSVSGVNLIPIAATSLISNGFYDSTNAPNDITGRARSVSTPTIGPWEVIAGTNLTVSASSFSSVYSLQTISVSASIYGVKSFVTIRL